MLAAGTLRGAAQGDTMVMLGTYYADKFVGRKTACGDIFRQNQYTAAHKSIPFGTYLKVYNPYSGLEIVVRVNDRCPVKNVLDMTKIAVLKLGIKGSRKVQVVALDPDEGYALWIQQDTLAMSHEEYMAFKDKSPVRRMTPYAPNSAAKPADKRVSRDTGKVKEPARDTTRATVVKVEESATTVAENNRASTGTSVQKEPVDEGPSLLAELPTPKQEKLYDLAVCITGSRQSAHRAILRMPKELQSRARIEAMENTRQVRVVLDLSTPRSHAIRVQAMLIEDFPESFLVPHNDREKGGSE